jgi:hypothetical protein
VTQNSGKIIKYINFSTEKTSKNSTWMNFQVSIKKKGWKKTYGLWAGRGVVFAGPILPSPSWGRLRWFVGLLLFFQFGLFFLLFELVVLFDSFLKTNLKFYI